MKANVLPIALDLSKTEFSSGSGLATFQVIDYSLFMYGLVRGNLLVVAHEGQPRFSDLEAWELDGVVRVGLPQIEKTGFLTRIAGLVTASKVEFSVTPEESPRLHNLGKIIGVAEV
jgi:hypothetical protein